VVVTHHLPHPLCVAAEFKGDLLNPAYVSNLDDLIADNDINVWVHGHTHTNVDFEIHDTRILCNPRGYVPADLNPGYIDALTFEV
jgi:Icc-related predicted phosphoesterase